MFGRQRRGNEDRRTRSASDQGETDGGRTMTLTRRALLERIKERLRWLHAQGGVRADLYAQIDQHRLPDYEREHLVAFVEHLCSTEEAIETHSEARVQTG